MPVPVVSIVGNSESGKTSLIEKLIPAFKKRGYRVGSVKHAREINAEWENGKDSQRHLDAGSEAMVLATAGRTILFKAEEAPDIERIRQMFDTGFDLIVCEGFKQAGVPKIEVYRQGHGEMIAGLSGLLAVVSDAHLDIKTRRFSTDDVEAIADMVEREVIAPQNEWLDLSIDGQPVPLTAFPKQMIGNILTAMGLTLKGIETVKTVEIRMKAKAGRRLA